MPETELDTDLQRWSVPSRTASFEDPRWEPGLAVGRVLPDWVLEDDLAAILRNLIQAQSDYVGSTVADHPELDMTYEEQAHFDGLSEAINALHAVIAPQEHYAEMAETNSVRNESGAEPLPIPVWLRIVTHNHVDDNELDFVQANLKSLSNAPPPTQPHKAVTPIPDAELDAVTRARLEAARHWLAMEAKAHKPQDEQ